MASVNTNGNGNGNGRVVFDPKKGTLTIPVKILRRALAQADDGKEFEHVPAAETVTRDRTGQKADIVRGVMDRMPEDATLAEMVNAVHDRHPEISKPNARYLVNRILKTEADTPAPAAAEKAPAKKTKSRSKK